MGSGKSSAGKKIAASLRWKFIDTDRLIESGSGLSVADMFSVHGEAYFREAEKKVLKDVSARSRTVVACGGGTPCSDDNMAIMKKTGVVLYLRLPVRELVMRLQKSRTVRPLLHNITGEDLVKKVGEMLESRRSWYEKADIIADGQITSVDDLTMQLAESIRAKGAYL